MARQIALLRGINIGPNKRVPMPRLRELLAEHGYEDVKTYVASGNVVLTSEARPRKLEKELEKLIEDELGFDVAVIVRTRDELADVIERMPFGDVVEEPLKRLQVSFLSGKPDADDAKKIKDACASPSGWRSTAGRSTPGTPTGSAARTRQAAGHQAARRHRHRAQLEHGAGAARARRRRVLVSAAAPRSTGWFPRRLSPHRALAATRRCR